MATQPTTNKIRVANPPLEGNSKTYLTANAAVGATLISVTSVSGFPGTGDSDFFVLYNGYENEKAEIKLIDASETAANVFTSAATTSSHETSDPLIYIGYDQIRVFGLTSETGTKNLIDTIYIDTTQQYTEYTYTGDTYTYFTTAYYNSSDDTISGYSPVIQSTSFTRSSAKRIIEAGLRKAMTTIDESPDGILNWDNCLEVLEDGIDEILTRKRNWSFLAKSDSSTTTTSGQNYIEKPSDISLLQFLIVNNRKLDWVSPRKYNYNYYDSAVQTNGEPVEFTEKNNKYYLNPTPGGAYTVIYEYYKNPANLGSLSAEVDSELTPALIYYCASEFSFMRGNEKQGNRRYTQFQNMLEQLTVEYGGPLQTGEAESVEETSAISADTSVDYLN